MRHTEDLKTMSGDTERTRKSRVLVTASVVSSLIMLDSNIVAVSLPSIARSIGASFADIEWVVSAYVLVFAALLLGAGAFADRHGRKRATLIGLALFLVASGLCGFSTSALSLNLSRALQGAGASLLLTASLAVINHTFEGQERAAAYAFWGSCLGIAITSGPIVGGLITNYLGWRWAFLINLPVCAVLLAAAALVFTESQDPEAKRLDWAGILTFSVGLFLLVWALIDGNNVGWSAPAILWRFAGAAVLLSAFVLVELKQERPMVDFDLFRQRTFVGSAISMLGYAGGAQVLIFFLPMFLQNAFGFSPAVAGAGMIPFALPMFLTPRLGVSLSKRYSGRALLTVGLVITALGDFLLYVLSNAGANFAVFSIGMIVVGIGAGLLNSETAKVMQSAVPAHRAGMASGLSATTRFLGLLLGVAGLGAVLSHNVVSDFTVSGAGLFPGSDQLLSAAKRVASGDIANIVASMSTTLQATTRHAAMAAFAAGFGAASLLAASVAALTAAATFWLVRWQETAPAKVSKAQNPLTTAID